MRVLHTSDWHIGKRLLGRERISEQREVLLEISRICEREKIELVLVAGDVFDTYLPSSEAEDLFYTAIKMLAGDERAVVVISGNHDDNLRLTAATSLSEEHGIYIFGNNLRVPNISSKRKVHPVRAGVNFLEIENEKGECVFLNLLPYPSEARFKEEKRLDESFYDKMKRWINLGEVENVRKLPSVFMSHIFIAGGKVSEGEREIDLGGARAVPLELLPESDYVALGHLHRKQQCGDSRVYYSGSILQYAFDEANVDKKVIVFDITKDGVSNLNEIKLTSGKTLVRLAANGVENAIELLKNYKNSFIELTIYLQEPLTSMQIKQLKDVNEGLISIIPEIKQEGSGHEFISRKNLSPAELFVEYYKSQYGAEPPQDIMSLYLEITQNDDET